MLPTFKFFALLSLIALCGCASTKLSITTSPPDQLCGAAVAPLETTIFWTAHWRPDQKEPARRELAAEKGIRKFVSSQPCLSQAPIHRLPVRGADRSEQELRALALESAPGSKTIITIVVRELGPVVLIGIPMGLRGGTEVLMGTYVFDAPRKATLYRTQVAWEYGGPLFLRSADELDKDMSAALCAVFSPEPQLTCPLATGIRTERHAKMTHPRWRRPGETMSSE
jgi:hypothetical protein